MTARPMLSTAASLYVIFPILLILTAVSLFLKAQQIRREEKSVSSTQISNQTNRQTDRQTNRQITHLLILLLLIYLLVYIWLTFLCRRPAARSILHLMPFWSYREAFELSPFKIKRLGIARQILLNILLTMPLGLLLPLLLNSKKHPFLLTTAITLILAILTEALQYLTRLGMAELDDVFDNLLGALLGMQIINFGTKIMRKNMRINDSIAVP